TVPRDSAALRIRPAHPTAQNRSARHVPAAKSKPSRPGSPTKSATPASESAPGCRPSAAAAATAPKPPRRSRKSDQATGHVKSSERQEGRAPTRQVPLQILQVVQTLAALPQLHSAAIRSK